MLKVRKSLSSTIKVCSFAVASIFRMKSFSGEEPPTGHHVRVLQLALFFEDDARQPSLALVPEELLAVFGREGRVGARETALWVSRMYG
jgi:hypothetical protein